jgi:hypothetical protein
MQKFLASGRLEDISSEAEKRESELTRKQLTRMKSDKWKRGFPFYCDIDNFDRHDHYDAMKYHHIYRDLGERRLPATKPESGPLNLRDYPELTSITEAIMYDRGPSYSVSGPIEILETMDEAERTHTTHDLEETLSQAGNGHDSLQKGPSGSSLQSSDENFIRTYDGRDFHYAPGYKER